MKHFWYIFILLAVVVASCHKKEFPPSTPDTVSDFYFTGTVAGSPVSLKAGIDNYYMYASHSYDNGAYYKFIADLRPAGCTGCKSGIQVIIHDYKLSLPGDAARIDSSLLMRAYPVLGAPFYAVQFNSLFNTTAASYLWKFGDGSTSTQANPVHTYSAMGNYNIGLFINSTGGCQQYISNVEKIRYPFAAVSITSADSSNSKRFSASAQGNYRYHWKFGDGDTSNSVNPAHYYTVPGTYPVSLRLIGPSQDTLYARYNVATITHPMPCLTNYSIGSVTRVVNPSPFSNIIINWTDENGVVYTSNSFDQPATSSFRIVAVEDYDLNERSEKTKRIKVVFSCMVFNGAQSKAIENAEAVLCVSYK